jgi:hypothetical protein
MKAYSLTLLVSLFSLSLCAQDTTASRVSKFKISLSFGMSFVNPTDINDHISTSNALFDATTPTIKSVPEIAATVTFHPLRNNNILVLRGGYMWVSRSYQISVPETNASGGSIGTTTGTIKETYTAYPLSLGVGMSMSDPDAQWQAEFIYGLGYIKEEGSYVSSSGRNTSYTRTLFSPTYGFRLAAQTTVQLSESMGLTFEIAYRGMVFDQYEDETSTQPANIKFSYAGFNGSIGLSILL